MVSFPASLVFLQSLKRIFFKKKFLYLIAFSAFWAGKIGAEIFSALSLNLSPSLSHSITFYKLF
jgi:hypothetical protein